MLSYRNNSDTLIVVLHEIYGINDHIAGVCQSLADSGYDVVCPDLLDGKPPYDYAREEEAYQYFMNFEGFESSAKRITFLVRQEEYAYRRIFLLGYSAGATIAWLCGADSVKPGGVQYGGSLIKCSGVICYYGSRIRDYMEIIPKGPTLLLFPEDEKSFDPYELQKELKKKEKAEVHILEGKHGFADPYSANYHEASAREARRITEDFLERIS
jgi:dienelactone hydrolase